MERLQTAWEARSRREKIMLAGLAILLVAIVGWYGVWKPVQNWQDATAFDRKNAEMRQSRMAGQIAASRTYSPAGQNARQALEQAARQADVQVQITTQGGGLAFDLDRTPSASGRAFLMHMEEQKLSPRSLRINGYDDGTLHISGQLG